MRKLPSTDLNFCYIEHTPTLQHRNRVSLATFRMRPFIEVLGLGLYTRSLQSSRIKDAGGHR